MEVSIQSHNPIDLPSGKGSRHPLKRSLCELQNPFGRVGEESASSPCRNLIAGLSST